MKNDIVLVAFPFDDFSTEKVRPVVCLTNEIGEYRHVIVAFISSQISNLDIEYDVETQKSSHDFETTGLKLDSVVKLHKITTLSSMLIKRKIGVMPESYLLFIREKLRKLFELP